MIHAYKGFQVLSKTLLKFEELLNDAVSDPDKLKHCLRQCFETLAAPEMWRDTTFDQIIVLIKSLHLPYFAFLRSDIYLCIRLV